MMKGQEVQKAKSKKKTQAENQQRLKQVRPSPIEQGPQPAEQR